MAIVNFSPKLIPKLGMLYKAGAGAATAEAQQPIVAAGLPQPRHSDDNLTNCHHHACRNLNGKYVRTDHHSVVVFSFSNETNLGLRWEPPLQSRFTRDSMGIPSPGPTYRLPVSVSRHPRHGRQRR